MNPTKNCKQKGIGLIEVLIALLVVSLGLLALASFQGSLLKASGSNKARAEAIGIAQQELELIRYAATRSDDFVLVPTNPAAKTIVGTNASFTVTSVAEDPITNSIINVVVNVAWTDAAGDPDNVTLMSEVGLQDIQKSAFATNDSAAAVAVPSPRQSASEDVRPASETIDPNDVISPTETPLPATGTVSADNTRLSGLAETFSVNSTGETPVSYTLRAIAEDSRYYNTYFGDGNLAVYVCESTAANGCRYIQNHFGGVSLSTSGIIYSVANTNNQLTGTSPVWSSSEVTACYDGPVTQTGSVYSKPYECVYAGNCADDETKCQNGVTVAEVSEKGVGPGGEFGNLGLIDLDGGNGGDQVCFLEDTPNWNSSKNILNGNYDDNGGGNTQNNEDYLFPSTTRAYVARRMMSNGNERSEGINKSYRNHNFLLTNRQNSPDTYKNCYNAVISAPLTYVLAPKNIVRVLGNNDLNLVEPTTTFAGTMPGITIRSTYAGVDPNLYINENGACYFDRDAVDNGYACIVPQNTVTTTIFGSSNSVPAPTNASPAEPVNYRTCSATIDLTQSGNLSTSTPCLWSNNF